MATPTLATALALAFVMACGEDAPNPSDLGGSLTVSGDVYDYESGAKLSGTANIATAGLSPLPIIDVMGASFTITDVLEYSAFQIIASADPTHRRTYNASTEVVQSDLTGVKAYTVSETFLTALATGFNVTPTTGKGILILQLVDASGNPKSGVAASNIVLAGATGASAPRFLDANKAAAPMLTASSASGIAVIFDVPEGVVQLGAAVNATATLTMPTSPVGGGAVTLATAVVTDGPPVTGPTNVSFSTMITPIFKARGCTGCHSGNGPGRELGGLKLDGGANPIYKELTTENPLRVQTAMPEKSLVLTMPSAESPPDTHPNITFTGPQDPDYLKILVWIREGAKQN